MLHYVETDTGYKQAYSDGDEYVQNGNEVYRATWDGAADSVTVVLGDPGPVFIPFLGWPQVGIAQ